MTNATFALLEYLLNCCPTASLALDPLQGIPAK